MTLHYNLCVLSSIGRKDEAGGYLGRLEEICMEDRSSGLIFGEGRTLKIGGTDCKKEYYVCKITFYSLRSHTMSFIRFWYVLFGMYYHRIWHALCTNMMCTCMHVLFHCCMQDCSKRSHN